MCALLDPLESSRVLVCVSASQDFIALLSWYCILPAFFETRSLNIVTISDTWFAQWMRRGKFDALFDAVTRGASFCLLWWRVLRENFRISELFAQFDLKQLALWLGRLWINRLAFSAGTLGLWGPQSEENEVRKSREIAGKRSQWVQYRSVPWPWREQT